MAQTEAAWMPTLCAVLGLPDTASEAQTGYPRGVLSRHGTVTTSGRTYVQRSSDARLSNHGVVRPMRTSTT